MPTTIASVTTNLRPLSPGVRVERHFTEPGVHPFDLLEWEVRDAVIGDAARPAFVQRGVEFPRSWSQNATNIVAQKYFRGNLGTPERETSVRQMVTRVAGRIAAKGEQLGYFATKEDAEAFEAELTHILVTQRGAFNSPVWFNVGWKPEGQEQASACFILAVEDDMESILSWNTEEGLIFRGGSGSGINLSNIRASTEKLSRGGTASGPVSFMRGADSWAGSIKSGGGTRRAAKMVILDADHPDIRDFIWCKAKEEDKADALRRAGFDMSIDGDGFHSIQYQNANNSVRLTDDFMRAVEEDAPWHLTARITGEVVETVQARELMREIAEAAWRCADPGVQFDTTINDWHTTAADGRISASNPCFPGDARVHTTKGLLPIAELYERMSSGERIRVYTNAATVGGRGTQFSTPLAVIHNGVKPVVRLRFGDGRELRCTPDHRLWTTQRGFVAARDLTPDDRVVLNDSPTPASEASWELPVRVAAEAVSRTRGGTTVITRLPDRWSEGLGELLGHLLGDGCITDGSSVWIYGGDDVADGLASSHAGMLTELIGGISRCEMGNGTVQLRAGSAAVRDLLRGLGASSAKAAGKRVPESVFAAPTDVQAAFLRGLFGADGCVSRVETGGKANRYVGLGSRSEAALKDVQRLLSAWGIRGRIYRITDGANSRFSYTRRDGTTVEYAAQEGFDLRISGTDLERFADAIGFSTPRKQAALEAMLAESTRYRTKVGVRLVAREDDGQEVVYDLTEPINHSYIVDGVLVSNCSEYMSNDNSACNLASINLMKYRKEDGSFHVADFEATVDTLILAQEILVGFSSFPTETIARNARRNRQLGLGYANLGALLMSNGLPYDSDEGRSVAASITALLTGRAYRRSAEIAAAMGPYEGYADNRESHDRVMHQHRRAAQERLAAGDPVARAARAAWDDVIAVGDEHGFRNAQASVLAPTGTISFLMDCDTTGIEPDFSLVKFKELVGGGHMTIVNRTIPRALETLGYSETEIEQIEAHINERGTIVGAPGLADEHLPVFDVAVGPRAISHHGHIKMMGAAQPFISGAISKTANMPADATVEDVAEAYTEAWRLGVKALAIYRDGSKTAQALRTDAQDEDRAEEPAERATEAPAAEREPFRRRMPGERQSLTHKFSIGGHEGYITAGMYEDGTLGEIFLTDIGKEGSTLRGMMNAFATSISIALQYGVPLETLVRKFSYMRFDPEGITQNPEIPFAKSMPDYIMRWLASRFLDADVQEELGILTPEVRARKAAQEALFNADTMAPPTNGHGHAAHGPGGGPAAASTPRPGTTRAAAEAFTDQPPVLPARLQGLDLGPACSACGGMMQRTGSCYTCSSCGNNTGCG